ncbi:MAG TPA: [FeFe] hydrogenase H-cluster maturation GTPase HydF [Treponema sp.]|nr:[FeFe] hydrogenase H-cluster maturation GTPase HydF [Treponema sp.]
MTGTPKALRLHIGIFGRTNTGKSSFVNLITGQSTSIVSPIAGTTTDVVRKSMELLPIGPVTFLDTAGINDDSGLGELRINRTHEALNSSDIAILLVEPGVWTKYEEGLVADAAKQKTPLILVINKTDLYVDSGVPSIGKDIDSTHTMHVSCISAEKNPAERELIMQEFKRIILTLCPDEFLDPPTILGDLLPSNVVCPHVVLIVPIDLQAPKGRIILPQVQSIRDALDFNAAVSVVKESEYPMFLKKLAVPPDLVVCDSQVANRMVADTPKDIPCTTFSILFSRYKGNITTLAEGAATIHRLKAGDKVLIAEACSHHPLEDDIGRVKIPTWLHEKTGLNLECTHAAGKDYPADLSVFSLIIHCGACTLTRRETLWRIEQARSTGIPITNYGIAISVLQGVAERTLSPFPEALDAYQFVKHDSERGATP